MRLRNHEETKIKTTSNQRVYKGPYPVEQRTIGTGIGRFQSADSSRGNTIGGQISNMFNTESWPTLQRIGRRLWRIGRRLWRNGRRLWRIGRRLWRIGRRLWRIGLRLWRIGRRLYYPHTHTPIVEESALESVLESADYSSKSADSNADSPKIGLWVWALRVHIIVVYNSGNSFQLTSNN